MIPYCFKFQYITITFATGRRVIAFARAATARCKFNQAMKNCCLAAPLAAIRLCIKQHHLLTVSQTHQLSQGEGGASQRVQFNFLYCLESDQENLISSQRETLQLRRDEIQFHSMPASPCALVRIRRRRRARK